MPRESQSSDAVLMVRPASFGFNPETAASNVFAAAVATGGHNARAEFDAAASRLSGAGVETLILEDTPIPPKPDAAFPNNWVSFHADGTVAFYPMAAPTRRLERRIDHLLELLEARGFRVGNVVDLTANETLGQFLEGTGSLILDRPRRKAYAALGPRTSAQALAEFDDKLGYSTFTFNATDRSGRPVYHTNVMLSLGTRLAALCLDAVQPDQRDALVAEIESGGRRVIPIDYQQMRSFACNIIELKNDKGRPVVALSAAAKASLRDDQLEALQSLGGELVDVPIPTIEAVGGGSLRCMVADIHLPRR